MIQYGFQRLALLNSAGYLRAEVPLDAAVSLIAPNNTGKTSLINVLQFLLIIDKRRMDFGAHDVDASRRFYFPNNSAYVLLEVALPATGTVVLGCVGKGVGHDYEYFAYKGELSLDDFRLADGSTLQQPQLRDHMGQFGRTVFSYGASEFADALYGGRRRRNEHEPDFTVFKLDQASNASIFQKVLTRTLRLDRLTSSEVKAYLLEIFRHDLPDASIDFKAEWDKAFAEVNAERAQYDAACRQRPLIAQLERDQGERLQLRGKILHFRPWIDNRLSEWDAYQRGEQAMLASQQQQLADEEDGLQDRDRALVEEASTARRQQEALKAQETRLAELGRTFSLIGARSTLEARLAEAKAAYDAQAAIVLQASGSSVQMIQREIRDNDREQTRLARELDTLADNLYLRLRAALDPAQLDTLNCALSSSAMTLSPAEFSLAPDALKSWLDSAAPTKLPLPGLTVELSRLTPQHQQRSREEIQDHLRQLHARARQLEQQLAAAGRMARAERARLLKIDQGTDIDKAITARSRDWSQVRPEWGLAGCASFIVAPRARTQSLDLGGRAFLHSYDWRQDNGFGVLELIMTAPMVVASWINLQYYASTVDNRVFGSGNKALHNVVGALGVLEGNGGDLRVGLPWQSVHDGERYIHEPLRLNVLIDAPIEAMNDIIARHEGVRQLLDNGWVHLFALAEDGTVSRRYAGDLRWRPVAEEEATAAESYQAANHWLN